MEFIAGIIALGAGLGLIWFGIVAAVAIPIAVLSSIGGSR